ncbi:Gtp cyclohydrolase-2 [Mycena chlorophos]|uniref:GTP cyclohydrolase II n=1 Tax=Mycena chlorophos TaxID=658473 RepID=A0A8H6S2Q6_MYCCL|nr:Gtp cyclohydrolase-2 [Mycena chlorophos]
MASFDLSSDAALLEMLTAPSPKIKTKIPRRDAALDPLMIAAAIASGPHITRNHAAHDSAEPLPPDWSQEADAKPASQRRRLTYVSRQAPRRQRLGEIQIPEASRNNKENDDAPPSASPVKKRRPSLAIPTESRPVPAPKPSPVTVKCMARTRIPTPHGSAFLHLYHNNRDSKEHLAIVVDPAQYDEQSTVPPIRSASLDAVWGPEETETERITRGAYVGRLSATSRVPSAPHEYHHPPTATNVPLPLVRIHSECFTGETIGSMRCDCGEQLDEAIRLISENKRGAVVYLRQEGRGIGLLSKIRAYNLQDLGHDTVTANLMLGHGADERGYEIAGAILRDLGLAPKDADNDTHEGIKLLTNNPDKVEALQTEGVRVVERMAMVPRSWRTRDGGGESAAAPTLGANSVHGPDLDKYLRTKVLRMGHMLPLLLDAAQ